MRMMNEEVKNGETPENTAIPENDNNPGAQAADIDADNITANGPEIEQPKADDWQAKYNELNDKHLRLFAEFDNFKRRNVRERMELIASAGADVLKDMLPVMDDFERGLANMDKATDVASLKQGVELVYNKLGNVLKAKGLEPMNAKGQPFDADIHEAITNVPAPSEDMKGKVVEEVEKGYTLNGKVVRYAKVVVGS